MMSACNTTSSIKHQNYSEIDIEIHQKKRKLITIEDDVSCQQPNLKKQQTNTCLRTHTKRKEQGY